MPDRLMKLAILIFVIFVIVFFYFKLKNQKKVEVALVFCDVSTSMYYPNLQDKIYKNMVESAIKILRRLYRSHCLVMFYAIHSNTITDESLILKVNFRSKEPNIWIEAEDSLCNFFNLMKNNCNIRKMSCISDAIIKVKEVAEFYGSDQHRYTAYLISDMLEACDRGFFEDKNFHNLDCVANVLNVKNQMTTQLLLNTDTIINQIPNTIQDYDLSKLDLRFYVYRLTQNRYDPQCIKKVWKKFFRACGIAVDDSSRFYFGSFY